MQGADRFTVSNFSVLSKDTSTCGQVKPEIAVFLDGMKKRKRKKNKQKKH